MRFLTTYQLEIMLFMAGMCGILAIMTFIIRSLPRKIKTILVSMELSAMMLLIFDRLSYYFRGNETDLGFWMVRICNGMVFFLSLLIPFILTKYLGNVLVNDPKLERIPVQLKIADIFFAMGVALLTVSQFTGFYYTFDEHNVYSRAPGHFICYAFPFMIVFLQEWAIIKSMKKIRRGLGVSMIVFISLPTVASVLQIFIYGVSLTNMTTALVACVFFTYTLNFLSEEADQAKARELEYYKEAQKKEAALFVQTTEALAEAIDAKDAYTRGHSARVAAYSKKIAAEAGLDGPECDRVYSAALLHDIGKIGVSRSIINKPGKLTESEFDAIKAHAELGSRILSNIKQAPFLADGARYHHERYDGGGYPDGLAGEEIPLIARIIAVADSYDAMTSNRSYRGSLDRDAALDELEKGAGTQFDPDLSRIMINIVKNGL